jgi:hypothetical protein
MTTITTTRTSAAGTNSVSAIERLDHSEEEGMYHRRWFWLEIGLASLTGLLALVTTVFPDWIEFVSGWDPDQHDGSVERMIVIGLAILTGALLSLAAVEWHRTASAAAE